MTQTLAIIPAYNEEGSIKATIDELKRTAPHIASIVINDGSQDATQKILQEHKIPHLTLPCNLGLAGAFQAGMKYAFKHGYDYAIQIDGDGQHDPAYIQDLINTIEAEDADIVIGSRFIDQKKPLSLRMLGSAFITLMMRITTGRRITDPTSGMRIYSRCMIEAFAHNPELIPEPDTMALLIKEGAKVSEVPVRMRERTAGRSYLNVTSALGYMLRVGVSILFIQPFMKKGSL